MYTFYIKVLLSNGATINFVHTGSEKSSSEIVDNFFAKKNMLNVCPETLETKDSLVVGFNTDKVVAFWISSKPFDSYNQSELEEAV